MNIFEKTFNNSLWFSSSCFDVTKIVVLIQFPVKLSFTLSNTKSITSGLYATFVCKPSLFYITSKNKITI